MFPLHPVFVEAMTWFADPTHNDPSMNGCPPDARPLIPPSCRSHRAELRLRLKTNHHLRAQQKKITKVVYWVVCISKIQGSITRYSYSLVVVSYLAVAYR
jgi:hypothetical protein